MDIVFNYTVGQGYTLPLHELAPSLNLAIVMQIPI